MSKQWFAVDGLKIIATGSNLEECSEAARATGYWNPSQVVAPYNLQDFAPGFRPYFHQTVREFSRDGVVQLGQMYGRIERTNLSPRQEQHP
jgi:hypothetical protein